MYFLTKKKKKQKHISTNVSLFEFGWCVGFPSGGKAKPTGGTVTFLFIVIFFFAVSLCCG